MNKTISIFSKCRDKALDLLCTKSFSPFTESKKSVSASSCRYGPPNKNANCTVKDAVTHWLSANQTKLKDSSISRYQYLIDAHILPSLGDITLSTIDTETLDAFLVSKLQHGRLDGTGGLSAAYVRSIMMILDAAINYATEIHMCTPLTHKVQKPAIVRKHISILSPEDQQKIEACLLTDTDATKLGVLITLYTGLRIGEVCALSWKDIDLQNGLIYVRQTVVRNIYSEGNRNRYTYELDLPKTSSSARCVPICSKLYNILLKYQGKPLQHYVLSGTDQFVNPRTYEYRYKKIMHTCNVPCVNYHALRHTFATRCIEAGVDIKSLSEILGHSNTTITLNTYVHSSTEFKRQQLEKLVQLPPLVMD